MMRDKQVRYPLYGLVTSDSEGRTILPNEYDMLWLNNLKQVLGDSMAYWLLPIGGSSTADGKAFYFAKLPPVEECEIARELN